jgi:protein transport protein SEC61 subunit gamma-like protein
LGASAALARHVNGFIARTVSTSGNCPSLFCRKQPYSPPPYSHQQFAKMSDQIQELIDIPRDFIKDGTMFLNRCTKRKGPLSRAFGISSLQLHVLTETADRREFIKISQAVGVGFLVMGGTTSPHFIIVGEKLTFFKLAVGYVVKLSTAPLQIHEH